MTVRETLLDKPRPPDSRLQTADYLLIFGLPLTVFSALRAEWLPLGAGEILVALWILQVALVKLGPRHPKSLQAGEMQKATEPTIIFWCLAAPVLLAATALSILTQSSDPPDRYRDLIAYGLASAFCTALLLRGFTMQQMRTVYAGALIFFVVSTAFSLLYYETTGTPLFGIAYDGRFAAFSTNANQPNVLLAPIPFLALYFAKRNNLGWKYVSWIAIAATAVLVGSQTGSDGLILSWYVGAVILAASAIGAFIFPRKIGVFSALASVLSATSLVIFAGLMTYLSGSSIPQQIAETVSQNWDGGDSRLALWSNALTKLSESPIVGFGVGAHSYFNFGPTTTGTEAHNFLVDWTLQTGVVGLILLLWLLFRVGALTWRSGHALLLAAFATVLITSMTSFFMRHPIFWFNLIALSAFAISEISEFANRNKRTISMPPTPLLPAAPKAP